MRVRRTLKYFYHPQVETITKNLANCRENCTVVRAHPESPSHLRMRREWPQTGDQFLGYSSGLNCYRKGKQRLGNACYLWGYWALLLAGLRRRDLKVSLSDQLANS